MKNKAINALTNNKAKEFAYLHVVLSLVSIISITGIILESIKSMAPYYPLLEAIEWGTVVIFSIEYLARVATSRDRLKYMLSFWGLIDLMSIAPAFFGFFNLLLPRPAEELRILNLIKIIRLGKISKAYIHSHQDPDSHNKINGSNTAIYFIALFTSVVSTGAILHLAEGHQVAYRNIPMAMIQSSKILLGGLSTPPATTIIGELAMIFTRFIGLALFGLLIHVIGEGLRQLLFGKEEK